MLPNVEDLVGTPLLVVTDKYPPNSVGGAEQSLHVSLKKLSNDFQCVVVTFSDAPLPQRYVIDGVEVLVLPNSPYNSFSAQTTAAVALRLIGIRRWHELPQVAPADRELQKYEEEFVFSASSVAKDSFRFAQSVSALILAQLLYHLKPRHVHADNYRAIVALSFGMTSKSQFTSSCLIRDNRFHCVRDSQSVMIKGKYCKTCDLNCAKVDAPNHEDSQLKLLKLAQVHRTEALLKFDRVLVTSQYLSDSVAPLLRGKNVSIVPNAGDDPDFVASVTRGVGERVGVNLLLVGMLTENKGQIDFVKKSTSWLRQNPTYHLHFAGRGDRIKKRILQESEAQGVSESLSLHGYLSRSATYELYRKCQIVIAPTVWPEPFGRVPLEAGLTRRPCVAFRVGGLSESIIDGKTGYLIEPGDYKAFHDAVTRLADNPDLRWAMGEAAFQHISTKYSLQSNVDLMTDVFKSARPVSKDHPTALTTYAA